LYFEVSPDGQYVRWSYYQDVYNNDCKRSSDSPTRVCPKRTLRHLDVDGFSKMNVKLGTQVICLIHLIVINNM